MAVGFVAGGAFVTRNGSGTFAPSVPSGSNGDLLVLLVLCDAGTGSVTTPSGYTLKHTITGLNAGTSLRVYHRTRDGSEGATLTVTTSGAGNYYANITAMSGANTTNPIGAYLWRENKTSTTNPPAPGMYLPAGGACLVVGFTPATAGTAGTLSGDSMTWGEIAEIHTNRGVILDYGLTSSAVTVTEKTFTMTGGSASADTAGFFICISPTDINDQLFTSGSGNVTAPTNATAVRMQCIGAGGGGTVSTSAEGGGGGGAFSETNSVSVTGGSTTVYYSVGAGGTAGNAGGDSWTRKDTNSAPSATTDGCLAKGGGSSASQTGGTGGATASGVGDTLDAGNNGATGQGGGGSRAGSGGGSAGSLGADGSFAAAGSGSTAGTGGVGGPGAGNGGAGGASGQPGNAGYWPGGAGGGGGNSGGNGGTGGDGAVRLLFTIQSGATITCDPGSYSVTGTAASLLWGHSMAVDPGSYAITGTDATLAKGFTLTVDPGSYAITGTKTMDTLPAAIGSYAITGTAAGLFKGYYLTGGAEIGSYTISGQTAALLKGYYLTGAAEVGSYTISGQAVGSLHGYYLRAEPPTTSGVLGPQLIPNGDYSTSPGGWTLSPSTGTLVISGGKLVGTATEGDSERFDVGSSIIGRTYLVELDVDSLSAGQVSVVYANQEFLKGSSTGHRSAYAIDVTEASTYAEVYWYLTTTATVDNFSVKEVIGYGITGVDAGLSVGGGNTTIIADVGSYSVTGTTANLLRGYQLTAGADVGAYNLTGTAATLAKGFALTGGAVPGSYIITGVATMPTLPAATGSYLITGVDASLVKGPRIVADVGNYTYTGTAVTLLLGRVIPADVGSYIITGQATTLIRGYVAAVDPGSYTITGTAVSFLLGKAVAAVPGSYIITGQSTLFAIGTMEDLVPLPPELVIFRHQEAEFVRVPKLNAVAAQAFAATRVVVSMAELAHIAPTMGSEIHVWDASGGYAPAYADGINWRKMVDGSILI